MKVTGIKRTVYDFDGNNGHVHSEGYTVYVTEPIPQEQGAGQATEKVYISDVKCAECNYKPVIGQNIRIGYNRRGKVDFIIAING